MGLRPLLFHVDAGWNTDQAVSNIEKLVDGLGFDLYTDVVNWQSVKRMQVAFLRSGIPIKIWFKMLLSQDYINLPENIKLRMSSQDPTSRRSVAESQKRGEDIWVLIRRFLVTFGRNSVTENQIMIFL